jgi:isopenicillin N synthase-like dioxygenase
MTGNTTIPVVSFEKFLTGTRENQSDVAAKVYDAFSKIGFIYLKDHGISQERVDEIFQLVGHVVSFCICVWHSIVNNTVVPLL